MIEAIKAIIVFVAVALLVGIGLQMFADDVSMRAYLEKRDFTTSQQDVILQLKDTTVNPDHYIKRLGAIAQYEMGGTFIDGTTKYFAGRLKGGMEYKDFTAQAKGWTEAYNKYRYKNKTIRDWIYKSHYCVTDNDGAKYCPNWQSHVARSIQDYEGTPTTPPVIKKAIADKPVVTPPITRRRCKIIYRTQQDGETIQLDDYLGKFIGRFRKTDKGTKVFTCIDL